MDYNETLKYISKTPKFTKNLGNSDLKILLDSFGNPQEKVRFVHIAGTNGKGSVCAMTALALQSAGYKTGLFVSPFINTFNERIQINGKYIPDDILAEIATRVKTRIGKLKLEISEFAQITAIAFLYYLQCGCDIAVLETGLGGRLDATNVIPPPEVCAITKIGLDHTEYLGNTIAEIAAEKCGIIKKGVPVVTCLNQPDDALSVIKKTCTEKSCSLSVSGAVQDMEIGMKGSYQRYNSGMCLDICRLLGIDRQHAEYAIKNARLPARFEYLTGNLILDGGHNPDAVRELTVSLAALNKPVTFVIAMMQDKDYRTVCSILKKIAARIIVTQIDIPRCLKAETLAEEFDSCETEPDCKKAVRSALASAGDGIVCVCGSLYLAAEIRKLFPM